jgi:hypothetical protein
VVSGLFERSCCEFISIEVGGMRVDDEEAIVEKGLGLF